MIRFFSILTVVLLFSIGPVMAQEDADAVLADQVQSDEAAGSNEPFPDIAAKDNYEERLTLARKMHEIWPIRPKVESALDNATVQLPEDKRLQFKAAMRQSIEFDALEQASIEAMAYIFTAKELEAMIAFYGSKEGRSVSHKTLDYERALQPVLTKMLDKALMDTKVGSQ